MGVTNTPRDPQTASERSAGGVYAWAPAPRRRRRRLGLWIGTPVAAALTAIVATSLVLIAPGTAVAGVEVGGMTPGAAAAAIRSRLDHTTVRLHGDGVEATLTGAQLGASVDAHVLADAAHSAHPMWNVGAWFSGAQHAPVRLDAAKAAAALRGAVPGLFRAPQNAAVRFDAAKREYVVQPAVAGTGVGTAALAAAVQEAFASGAADIPVTATTLPVAAAVTTRDAQHTSASLNAMLAKAGFYVGDERTVPLSAATVASWLTVTATGHGFDVTADVPAIQKAVDALPREVDRAPQDGTVITDTSGRVLQTQTATLDGRTLGDTDGVAASFARKLAAGDGVSTLPVTVTKASTTRISRNIVVSLSRQTTYLYQDGRLVDTYLISSGVPGHATQPGSYRIFAKVPLQDMGCVAGYTYCTKNVPWVSYFYPNVAFHGTYWHHNFGHVMSHGCVNMPIDVAKFVYDWAPIGTQVVVED